MDAIELADLVRQPVRVDLGVLGERERHGLDDNVVERRLVLVAHFRELRSKLGGACRVELRGEKESRDGAIRLGKPARDCFPDLSESDILEVALSRQTLCGRRATAGSPGRFCVLDVALEDPTAGPASLDSAELNSALAGKSARSGEER